jgi:hypothetical protein
VRPSIPPELTRLRSAIRTISFFRLSSSPTWLLARAREQ